MLGLGDLQVAATAAAVTLAALGLGVAWRTGLAAGLILARSSTAIVLQSLGEKGLLKTPGGEACFSVLLFQDIAVIPLLTILPLLAPAEAAPSANPRRRRPERPEAGRTKTHRPAYAFAVRRRRNSRSDPPPTHSAAQVEGSGAGVKFNSAVPPRAAALKLTRVPLAVVAPAAMAGKSLT